MHGRSCPRRAATAVRTRWVIDVFIDSGRIIMERFEYVALTTNEILNESAAAEIQGSHKRLSVRVVGARKIKETVLNRLNALGSEGWELAGVSQKSERFIGSGGIESAVYFLKRRIGPSENREPSTQD